MKLLLFEMLVEGIPLPLLALTPICTLCLIKMHRIARSTIIIPRIISCRKAENCKLTAVSHNEVQIRQKFEE